MAPVLSQPTALRCAGQDRISRGVQRVMSTTSEPVTISSSINPFRYQRRATRVVMVGDVAVGGNNPIRVQSMTTTRTQDVDATVAQTERLVRAGCEIVRITAPTV